MLFQTQFLFFSLSLSLSLSLTLSHSLLRSFSALSSRIAILEVNSALCTMCHNAVTLPFARASRTTRRRCRLSHRASSISNLAGFFHSRLHIEERSRKQAIGFDRCLFSCRSHFSLSFSPLPPLSLSLFLYHKRTQ